MADYERLRREALPWIRSAGQLACPLLGKAATRRKTDQSPVTQADLTVQNALVETIGQCYPHDAIITEEEQQESGDPSAQNRQERCWVIDPIDGTRNFARGMPIFSVSVALLVEGKPAVGAVYEPMSDRMYSASVGGGLWVDEQAYVPSDNPLVGELFIGVPAGQSEGLPSCVHGWLDQMNLRNVGSTALHLAYLATGSFDAVFCRKNKLWDIAAGALLITEAGATIKSLSGEELFPLDLTDYTQAPLPFLAARDEQLFHRLLQDCRSLD